MAFDIQGRLVLTGPFPSAQQMAQDIQRQLNNISVNVQLNIPQGSAAQISQVNQAMNSVNTAAKQLNTQLGSTGNTLGQLNSQVTPATTSLTQLSTASRTSITQLKELENSTRNTTNAFTTFSDQVGYVTKRFAAYAVAATAIVSVTQAMSNGISDAIAFQNELVKLSQIGENSASNIRAIAASVTELSQKYGTASKDLIASAVTLRQAGLDARQTAIALETLAQAATSPNFDNMARNTEGAIAVMNQFRLTAEDLQRSFSSINAVAADFPVQARDIQEAVIRTGGVFSQLGGNLNEFIALFTSVKSVTQESSESIASGLRNIFSRLQSEATLDTLREFRINLRYTAEEARALGNVNFTNQFVGAAEAVKRIQTGLRDLQPTDPRYARIIESIGGTRQIGRALPLISQQGADIQQRALNIAEGGGASLAQSAERGLASLSRQATQTSEKFQELFRVITNSEGFTGLAGGLLAFGNRLAEVLKLLTPAIPLFTTLAAIRFGEGLFNFAATRGAAPLPNAGRFAQGGYASGGPSYLTPGEMVVPPINATRLGYGSLRKLNQGGGFLSDNNGFIVPGVGNQDSELHDLAPGSFVIRKSSVNKIRGYASGGPTGWESIGDNGSDVVREDYGMKFIRAAIKNRSQFSGINLAGITDKVSLENFGEGATINGKTFRGVYHSGKKDINLNKSNLYTKGNALGVLLHEYGHAADNFLGDRSKNGFLSDFGAGNDELLYILNNLNINQFYKNDKNRHTDREKFAELFSGNLGVKPYTLEADENFYKGIKYLRKNINPLLPKFGNGGNDGISLAKEPFPIKNFLKYASRQNFPLQQSNITPQSVESAYNAGLFNYIPKGSEILGTGLSAAAFRKPEGDVLRLQFGIKQLEGEIGTRGDNNSYLRPNIPEVLQNTGSIISGTKGKYSLLENLPFAPSLAATRSFTRKPGYDDFHLSDDDIFNYFNLLQGLQSSGYSSTDFHVGNVGYLGDQLKVIDPGGLFRTNRKQPFVGETTGRILNKLGHEGLPDNFEEFVKNLPSIHNMGTVRQKFGFGDIVKNLVGRVSRLFTKKPEAIPMATFAPPTDTSSPSNVPQVVQQAMAQAQAVAPRFGVEETDKSTAFKTSFIEEKNSNAQSYSLAIQNLNGLLNAVGIDSFQSDLFNSPILRQIGVSNPDNLENLVKKIQVRIEQASNFSSKAGFDKATSLLIQKKTELEALKTAVASFQENLAIPTVDVTRVRNNPDEVIKHALELLGQGKAGPEIKEILSSTFGIAGSTASKYLSKAKKTGGFASGGRIESDSFYKSYFSSAYGALGRRSGINFNEILGLDKINVSSLLKKTSFGAPAAGSFSPKTGGISLFPGNYAGVSDSETDDKGFLLRTLIHELGHAVDFNLGKQILGKDTYLSGDKNEFRGAKNPRLNYSDLLLRGLNTKTNFTGYKKANVDYYNGPNELFAELFVEALGATNSRNRLKQDAGLERGIEEFKNLYLPLLPKFATGGLSPLDKVPALLTPGEFVINPETTARLGVANLDRANKGGEIGHIAGYNRGGVVGYATGGPLQIIDDIFSKMAIKFNDLIKDDKGSKGTAIANYGLPILQGVKNFGVNTANVVSDTFKSSNIEQRGFFTTSKSGETGYDYQKLLKHYKELEIIVQKQVDNENKNLSSSEKRQLTEDRLNQIKIKAAQYGALGSQFQSNRGEIKALLDVQALYATNKPGAKPLTIDETNRLAALQNENQEIQQRLKAAQQSLTFGFGKDAKGKDTIQQVDGQGSSGNFFQRFLGGGTNSEARNARLQAASTGIILASSYIGDAFSRNAGNPEDVARNGTGGATYTTGRALSQASIYGGIGFGIGNAFSPVGGAIGAGIGATVGAAEGTLQSIKELDLAKFALEINRSTSALNSFVGSIDRINKSFTDSEITQIQRDVGSGISNANQSYTREQSPGAISRLLTAVSLPYTAFEETQQGQDIGPAVFRAINRYNAIPESIQTRLGRPTSSSILEATESNQQTNARLQALNTRNPQFANAINRSIEGFDANQLLNNRDLTRDQRNAAIRQRFSTQELGLAATAQGIFNTRGTSNQIDRYFESQTTQNQRTAVERNLVLSGGTSATAYLELGFKRFSDNLSHAAESLENFGRNAEGVVQLLAGGTQLSRYNAPTNLLNAPIGTSQYFSAVQATTAGLGGPGQTLSRIGNITGQLGEVGPEILGNYLSQAGTGPTLERRLLDRLGVGEGSQEGAVVRNISQSVSAIGEGDRNRFATPFAREQVFQQELAKYNQALVSIAQQQERIANAEIAARQQILNLTLKRQEFLGKAADLDAQSLQFSAQQRAIRTYGSADPSINAISERQANAGFYSRINEIGRGAGPRGSSITTSSSLGDIFSLAQNALQNRNRLLNDTSSPVGTNRRAISEFENQLISATRILEIYANGTSRLSILQEKLNLVTQDRSNRIEGQRRFITGSDEDRAQTLQDKYVFEYIRNAGNEQQRTSAFNQLGQPGQAAYIRYSDQYSNVRFDANSTIGQERDRQLNAGLPPDVARSLNTEQDRLSGQISAILQSASTANSLLATLNASTAAQLQTEATRLNTEASHTLTQQIERLNGFSERQLAENVGGVAGRALSQVAGTPGFAGIQNTLGNIGFNVNSLNSASNRNTIGGILTQTPFGERTEGAGNTIDLLDDITRRTTRSSQIQEINIRRRQAFTPTTPALSEDSTDEEIARARLLYQNRGGMIYANNGFFQPRGSDTVPAMLTPGEMVVNASSTAANRGLLEQINNARGPVYRADGGYETGWRGLIGRVFSPFRTDTARLDRIQAERAEDRRIASETFMRNLRDNQPSDLPEQFDSEAFNRQTRLNAGTPDIISPDVLSTPRISPEARARAAAEAEAIASRGPKITGDRGVFNENVAPAAIANPGETNRFNATAASSPFSPLGFQADINQFGGGAAAFNFQQRATDNLLRQQLLAQTQTTGLYGTNFSGQAAFAQRQQQAQTYANITQQNRRYLNYQTPQNPNQQLLRYLRSARRFATGGMVEGEDNVPAFLSEGEFVMNRSATRNIGANNLYGLQRFANGGLVGNGGNATGNLGQSQNTAVAAGGDSAELIHALTSFTQNNKELVEALKGFPHTIELNATHKVEVIINGAAAFETMQETFRDMAIGLVDDRLQTFVKDNFPALQ